MGKYKENSCIKVLRVQVNTNVFVELRRSLEVFREAQEAPSNQ